MFKLSRSRRDQGAEVKTFFDAHAANYSAHFDPRTETGAARLFQQRLEIVNELARGRTGTLLDCATGTGEITRAVADSGRFDLIVANDISGPMLEIARQAFADFNRPQAEIRYCNHDVFELGQKLSKDRFDLVLCLGLIAHCGRLGDIFAQANRLMNKGGLLLLQSSVGDHWGVYAVRLLTEFRYRTGTGHKIFFFTIKDIESIAADHGFEVVEARRFGVCLPFGDRLLGAFNSALEQRWSQRCTKSGGEVILALSKL